MRAGLASEPIDILGLLEELADVANGATAIFLGHVRSSNEGREVTGIEYSAYDEMALREMQAILDEAGERYGVPNATTKHRVGVLGVGDVSIAVVVAAPHRAPAMDALRFIVDETKRRAPIWKLEHYVDGSRQWVNAGTGAPR